MSIEGIITAFLAGVALVLSAIATYRKANTESKQSTNAEVESHFQRQDKRLDTLERRLDAARVRERVRDDYIQLLRMHIADGKPPPRPSWPPQLLTND